MPYPASLAATSPMIQFPYGSRSSVSSSSSTLFAQEHRVHTSLVQGGDQQEQRAGRLVACVIASPGGGRARRPTGHDVDVGEGPPPVCA